MQRLFDEYQRIKNEEYRLRFRYPTQEELKELTIVHRDMSAAEERKIQQRRRSISDLVVDLKKGNIYLEDLDKADLEELRDLLRGA